MTYKTIVKESQGLYREKGSKFIAYLYPFEAADGLKEIIEVLRKAHPKSRHACFAYILGSRSVEYRLSDDGEPSGSAGLPIFNTLKSNELTNTLAVVVRYFGGTKLGVSGLIHAYKEATQDAINQTLVIERSPMAIYEIESTYDHLPLLLDYLKKDDIEVITKEFTAEIKLGVRLPKNSALEKLILVFCKAFKLQDIEQVADINETELKYSLISEED